MKRSIRWLYAALFFLAAAAVIWFLQLFIKVDRSISYINWTSSVQVLEDGTERPFTFDDYTNDPALSGVYCFTGTLPDIPENGMLVFETGDVSLSLSLDGELLWQSQTGSLADAGTMAQGSIPVAKGSTGELSVTCKILDGTAAMFPPLIRYIPENLDAIQYTAIANQDAFSSGAAALAFVLVFGIFLLGAAQNQPDFSLLLLMPAMLGMILCHLVRSQGYYFLPAQVNALFQRQELYTAVPVLFFLYLMMNRKRQFWKYLGVITAWSAAFFLLCCLASYLRDGYLFRYLTGELAAQLQAGMYLDLLYWITLWLFATAGAISAYGVLHTFTEQKIQAKSLALKNEKILENYRLLKKQTAESARARHEFRHQLTALDCLVKKQDYDAVSTLLAQMLGADDLKKQLSFTKNVVIDTILADATGRAAQLGIRFSAAVQVPEHLSIPETDLCTLLMNMLDNALAAAAKVPQAQKRYLSIRIKTSGDYLAIKCENSFTGALKRDKTGALLTTREDSSAHGLGCRQMQETAKKYQSIVHFDVPSPNVFLAETALLLYQEH